MQKELKVEKGNLVELRNGSKAMVTRIEYYITTHDGNEIKSVYPITLSNNASYSASGLFKQGSIDPRDIMKVVEVPDGSELILNKHTYVYYNNIAYMQEKYSVNGRIYDRSEGNTD